VSATAAFGEQLDSLGIWWPRGDGDGLRELAAAWSATAELIDDITAVVDTAAARVAEHFHGEAANRFTEHWATWSTTDSAHLPATAADCRRLAATLGDFGTDIDVADRTLLRLVEEALDGAATTPVAPTPAPTPVESPWIVWLRDCSNQLGNGLDDRVSHHCRNFVMIEEQRAVRGPSDVDRTVLNPSAITWPCPGTPIDRSSLATTPVDFGAGEGGRPAPISPLPNGPGSVGPGGPSGQVSIVVNGDGTTINLSGNVSAAPSLPPVADLGPEPTDVSLLGPAAALATADRVPGVTPELPQLDVPADALGSGGGGGGGGGFGGFSGGFSADAIGVPEPLDFSTDPPTDAIAPDIQVPINTSSGFAGAAAGTVAAGAAVAATAAKGSRPFLPFMPMSPGGMTGDEAPEPTRRRRRR
jgi:hypothetical protein